MPVPSLKSYPTPRSVSSGSVSRPRPLPKPSPKPDVVRVYGTQRARGTNLNG